MPLRVIAGTARGRRLKLVPGDSTRPIMDRVKEALFSIIGRDIIGTNFIDLFAGTGSVGIEALSRGAAHALFVDLDRAAITTIYENLKIARVEANAVVRRTDALSLLHQPPPRPYDYIFIAPPQYQGLWLKTLHILDQHPAWITPTTEVIVQLDPQEEAEVNFDHLEAFDRREYGNTLLWFFGSKETATEEEEDTP